MISPGKALKSDKCSLRAGIMRPEIKLEIYSL